MSDRARPAAGPPCSSRPAAAVRADSLRDEARYLPATVAQLAELRGRVIAAGHPPGVANGLVGWLISKAAGERDVTASTTRSRYRKILAALEADPAGPGPRRGPGPVQAVERLERAVAGTRDAAPAAVAGARAAAA